MKLQKAVILRICDLLIEHKMTRYALCKKIIMSEQTLKNVLDEKNRDIKLSTITKIAQGFNLTIDAFFKDSLFKIETLEFD